MEFSFKSTERHLVELLFKESQKVVSLLNNQFKILLISSFSKDFKVERERIVKEAKKLSGVFKIKGSIMLIIISNLLILWKESSANQKYKLMEASRKLMSMKI